MDREISVTKEELLFAKVKFSYETQVSGHVEGTYYNSYWVVPGLQASIPTYHFTKRPFKHDVIPSMEVLKEYDVLFLNEQEAPYPSPGDNAVFEYLDFRSRYPINKPLYGIVDVMVDFGDDMKIIKFTSADNWAGDKEQSASCLKADVTMIAHMAEVWESARKNKIF